MKTYSEVIVTGECKVLVENPSSAAKAIEYAVELLKANKHMGKFRFSGAIVNEIPPSNFIDGEKSADLVSKDDT